MRKKRKGSYALNPAKRKKMKAVEQKRMIERARVNNPASAARIVARFNDVPVASVTKKTVDITAPTGVALQIGRLIAVAYDTGARKYVHRFRKNAQPLLIASNEGKQLLIVGGKFRFTDRGIIDL